MKLIDKDALVAEIEKYYNECLKMVKITDSDYWNAKADAYRNVLVILDYTLEVKEVDLEKEINIWCSGITTTHPLSKGIDVVQKTAKHFFELGLRNATVLLTWEDIKEICNIAFEEACRFQRNMKGALIYKEQHCLEVLKRFKTQKRK